MHYNLVNYFNNLAAKRKKKQEKETSDNGFSWVMCAYFREKMSLEEIEGQSYTPNDYSHFDYGVRDGILLIEEFKRIKLKGLLKGN